MSNVQEKDNNETCWLFVSMLLCRKIEVLFRGVNLIILQATVDEHLLDVVRNQVKYIYENSLHCRSLTIYIALEKKWLNLFRCREAHLRLDEIDGHEINSLNNFTGVVIIKMPADRVTGTSVFILKQT